MSVTTPTSTCVLDGPLCLLPRLEASTTTSMDAVATKANTNEPEYRHHHQQHQQHQQQEVEDPPKDHAQALSGNELTDCTNTPSNPKEQQLQQQRLEQFESNLQLQELCRANGLSSKQFAKKAHAIETLEMFLGFWPSMQCVGCFANLRELAIVKHPTICRLEGLEACVLLEKLCVTECGLERVEGLDKCTRLRQLNLSSNNLRAIENLDDLSELEELWLNDNKIDRLDALWHLGKLRQLWICRNRIERIEGSLNGNRLLRELNLADNQISSFKTLASLSNLAHLTRLSLQDPHFGDNPVCKLCNYQTFLMCQLPQLQALDCVQLCPKSKQIAECTMMKKRMYYNMRIKGIKKEIAVRLKRMESIRKDALVKQENEISFLARQKKQIERFLLDFSSIHKPVSSSSSSTTSPESKPPGSEQDQALADQFVAKSLAMEQCILDRVKSLTTMTQEFDHAKSVIQSYGELLISRLVMELETGGNIRLEDGKHSDVWYHSCVDLIRSRMYTQELQHFGIHDLQINRITRVSNRLLRNRFHSRVEELIHRGLSDSLVVKENVSKRGVTVPDKSKLKDAHQHDADPAMLVDESTSSSLEKVLEYLFYLPPLGLDAQSACDESNSFSSDNNAVHQPSHSGPSVARLMDVEQFVVVENGFRDPREYEALGVDNAIRLSNSIGFLETNRIILHDQLAAQKTRVPLTNVLIVVKVFPGNTVVKPETELPLSDSQRACKDLCLAKSLQSVQITKANDPKQKLYCVYDKALVLPEYLVEYQYVQTSSSTTGTETTNNGVGEPGQHMRTSNSHGNPTVNDVNTVDFGIAKRIVDDFERKYRAKKSNIRANRLESDSNATTTPSASGASSASWNGSGCFDADIVRVLQMEPPMEKANLDCVALQNIQSLECRHLKHLHLLACELEEVPSWLDLCDQLEVLVLSYNRISRLEHLEHVNRLVRLDASFNVLESLTGLPSNAQQLTSLEANCNMLRDWAGCLRCLKQSNLQGVTSVDLRKNPICEIKKYRSFVLQSMPQLECLDRIQVTSEEKHQIQTMMTCLNPQSIWDTLMKRKFHANRNESWDPCANGCSSRSNSRCGSHEGSKPEMDEEEHQSRVVKQQQPASWTNEIEELQLNRELISRIEGLDSFGNLRVLSICDNALQRIDPGIGVCSQLEELSLEDNRISKIENLDKLINLKKLNLARNHLQCIENLEHLENLTQLSLEENKIKSLQGLTANAKLLELYIGNNRIDVLKDVQHIKCLSKLTILDLSGNELTRIPDYRLYTVYHLRRIKVLDCVSISAQEQSNAKHKYCGKLSLDFVMEKCNNMPLDMVEDIDLSASRIRETGSIHGKVFVNLRDLNLENNQISDISGFESLPMLRALNLNHNRIDQLVSSTYSFGGFNSPRDAPAKECDQQNGLQAFPRLEKLFLASNQISDMTQLGLHLLPELQVLNLDGNAITVLNGLEFNSALRELHVAKNRIRQFEPNSLVALVHLRCFNLEENGIKILPEMRTLLRLECLNLSNNRVVDYEEVERLAPLPILMDLKLISCPIAKKHMYRSTVIHKLPSLQSLDGKDISPDEREKTDLLYGHDARNQDPLANATRGLSAAGSCSSFVFAPVVPPTKSNAMQTPPMQLARQPSSSSVNPIVKHGSVMINPTLMVPPLPGSAFSAACNNRQDQFQSETNTAAASIAIAPSKATTKSLLNAVTHQRSSLASRSSAKLGISPSTSLLSTGLSAGGEHFEVHKPSVSRIERRRNSQDLNASASKLPSTINGASASHLSSDEFASLTGHGAVLHVIRDHLPATTTPLSLASSSSGTIPPLLPNDNQRAFTGYVVSHASQKRFPSIPIPNNNPIDSSLSSMATLAKPNDLGRLR